jgi:hypothetical protein
MKDFITRKVSKSSSQKGDFAKEKRDKSMAPQQLMTNPPPGIYEIRSRFDGKKGVLIATKTET